MESVQKRIASCERKWPQGLLNAPFLLLGSTQLSTVVRCLQPEGKLATVVVLDRLDITLAMDSNDRT